GTWSRASGSPRMAGSAQAMALTSIATLGGKAHRTATARSLLETREALLEEPLAPLAHHRARQIEAFPDDRILQAFGREQHDLGPHDVSIR
ncbi:MAG: hypothetical protein AABZ01_07595, partial [Gemmatimonadota bacterium]